MLFKSGLDGSATSQMETEIRVLFTETALYVGAVCHDKTPREIVATQLSRDADLDAMEPLLNECLRVLGPALGRVQLPP